MKLSTKKATALYAAIHETVFQYRVERKLVADGRKSSIVSGDIDQDMFYLTNRIHTAVEVALGINRPAGKERP